MRTIEEVLAERHQGDLISRMWLKDHKFTTQVCNGVEIESVDVVGVTTIDNAQTVDTTCPNCDSGYAQGYSDGYLKGKEERPTGHWIDDYAGEVDAEFGRHRYRCSCCGKRANYFIGGLDDWWDMEAPDFCPNCGADMRKEEKNE